MITYRATRDVPRELVEYLARCSAPTSVSREPVKALGSSPHGDKPCSDWCGSVTAESTFPNLAPVSACPGPPPTEAESLTNLGDTVMRPDGFPVWISDVEPGSVHDLTVAREHARGALYAAAARGLPTLADAGYEGAGQGVFSPIKKPTDGHHLHIDNRTYNMLLRSMRYVGERGFA